MMLPAPTLSFSIGSVHDDTPLDCRIYHPARWTFGGSHLESSPWQPRGAIVAHPYTALGGSYDDGVVLSVVSEVLKAGFVAGTFNFRGAGLSKGRSSWTGKPELLDYISFIRLFVYYLSALRPPHFNSFVQHHTTLPAPHALPSPSTSVAAPAPPLGITLILGGYSYGSLLTTYLPSPTALQNRFARAADGTPEARIESQALDLAARWNSSITTSTTATNMDDTPRGRSVGPSNPAGCMSMGGEACESEGHRTSVESGGKRFRHSVERPRLGRGRFRSRKSGDDGSFLLQSRPSTAGEGDGKGEGAASAHQEHIIIISQICYLLISPLLPPVSLFATMFSKLHEHHHHDSYPSQNTRSSSPSKSSPPSHPPPAHHTLSLSPPNQSLTTHPTLTVYGTRDFFCSHRKLRSWAENLAAQPNSLFRYREVENAGHFWQEEGVESILRRGVREWLLGDDVWGIRREGGGFTQG